MRDIEHGEEAATLLPDQHPLTPRGETRSRSQRRQALHSVLGVVAIVALVAGCFVAVDIVMLQSGEDAGAETTVLVARANTAGNGAGTEVLATESQQGWSHAWCSMRASTWCLFHEDKDACKAAMNCDGEKDKGKDNHKKSHADTDRRDGSSSSEVGSRDEGVEVGDESSVESQAESSEDEPGWSNAGDSGEDDSPAFAGSEED